MSDEKMTANDNELLEEEELDVTDGQGPILKQVETKTGEEDYEPLCKVKSKIWRFDEGENQWKERGQGEARILRSKADAKHIIFVFRRDGIGKVAAHHALGKGMTLKSPPNNERTFVWATPKDYTDDEEGFPEMFTIRFTSKELADEFKQCFESVTK